MGLPIIYYGEDFDSIVSGMQADAAQLLKVSETSQLLNHGE